MPTRHRRELSQWNGPRFLPREGERGNLSEAGIKGGGTWTSKKSGEKMGRKVR